LGGGDGNVFFREERSRLEKGTVSQCFRKS